MKGLIFTFAMILKVTNKGHCWVCPTNGQMFTEVGQSPVLPITTNGLHTDGGADDVNIFQVVVRNKNIFNVNYESGVVLGTPTQNGCSLASSADLANGVLDIELDTVQTNDWGTYRLVHIRRTVSVIQCVTLYLLGTPTTPTIAPSGTLYEGTSLSLTCSSTSTTQPSNHSLAMSFSWKRDGSKVTASNKFSFESNLQKTLTISGLSKTDDSNRVMECTATEDGGKSSLSTSYTISVQYGPENIRFNPPGDSKTYNDGDAFTPVSCLADCQPNCSFFWSKGGTLQSSTAFLSLGVVNSVKLGTYMCTATHSQPAHTMSKTLNVSVIYGPGSVSLSPSDANYEVTEGNTSVIITCIAMCNPECTYTWLKSGTRVSSTGILDLGQSEREKAGSYVCMARNPESGVSKAGPEVNVSVRYGPDNLSLSPSTTSYTVTEGNTTATITCSATCNPPCSYTWSKSGTTFSSTAILDLDQIERIDAGSYICMAKNPASGVLKNGPVVNFTVRFGPDNVTLSPSTTSYTVTEGNNLGEITCFTTCNPPCSYTWSRSGVTASSTDTLDLSQVERGKAGSYVCTARNLGSGFSRIGSAVNVNVRYGPDDVTFDGPNNHTVTEGHTVDNIVCSAECWPGCVFTWTNLTNDQTISTSESLTFGTVDRYDAGNYKCLAKNSAPQYTHETDELFSLRVQYAPDVFVSKSTAVFKENTPLELMCKASGVPAVYNYTGFVQRVGDVVVPNSHIQSPGMRDSISVNISSLQLQDTGSYTCYVHNGITGVNKQLIQTATQRIDVRASPVVLLEQTTFAGETARNITINIPFVSVPEFTTLSVLRHDGNIVSTRGKYTLHILNDSVHTAFYGQSVTFDGNVLQLTITDLSEIDFGVYSILITNDVNTTNFSMNVAATSKPSPPTELNLTAIDNFVTFEWKKGFNGGHEQTFVLQISLNSDDLWMNRTTVKEFEPNNVKENGKLQVNLTNLDPGIYLGRIVAFNLIGATDPVEFKGGFEIKELIEATPASSSGPLIGGAAGGGLGVILLAVIAVVIFVTKRKTKKGHYDSDRLTNGQKLENISQRTGQEDDNIPDEVENPMYVSGDDVDIPKVTTADIYATPDKTRPKQNTGAGDIYAVVDKKNQKQEIYENSDIIKKKKWKNSAVDKSKKKPVCEDGLLYADLVFANPPKGQKKLVIHGLDDMTEYAEVDLTKKADPLPDSDNEEDKKIERQT